MTPAEIKIHTVSLVALEAATRSVRASLYVPEHDRAIIQETLAEIGKPEHEAVLRLMAAGAIDGALKVFAAGDDAQAAEVKPLIPDGVPPGWDVWTKFTMKGKRYVPGRNGKKTRMAYETENEAREHCWEQHLRELDEAEQVAAGPHP